MKTTIVIEVEGGPEVDKRLDFLASAEGQSTVAEFFCADQALSLEAGVAVKADSKEDLVMGVIEALARRSQLAKREKSSDVKES